MIDGGRLHAHPTSTVKDTLKHHSALPRDRQAEKIYDRQTETDKQTGRQVDQVHRPTETDISVTDGGKIKVTDRQARRRTEKQVG